MKRENKILKKVEYEDIKNGTFVMPKDITEIGHDAFKSRKNLTFIDIPNNVKYIWSGAFAGCDFLKSVHIPDGVTYIDNWTFRHCTDLESIDIPDSVQWIGDLAFEGCTDLKSINIPNGVTEIGACAFANCKSLESINIPNSIKRIGDGAFANCKNLIKKGKYKACDIIRDGDNIIYSCRDTEYEIGKQMPVINNIKCCKRGYHYVDNLYDVFNYWHGNLNDIALFEIEPGDIVEKELVDNIYVTNTIKLVRRIPWNEVFEDIK